MASLAVGTLVLVVLAALVAHRSVGNFAFVHDGATSFVDELDSGERDVSIAVFAGQGVQDLVEVFEVGRGQCFTDLGDGDLDLTGT